MKLSERWIRLCLLMFVIAFAACGGEGLSTRRLGIEGFPECANSDGLKIRPTVLCIRTSVPGTTTAVFGYVNESDVAASLASGSAANTYAPDLPSTGVSGAVRPPSSFFPGQHPAAFTVSYPSSLGELTWLLAGDKVTTAGAPECTMKIDGGATLLEGTTERGDAASIVLARDENVLLSNTITPTAQPLGDGALGGIEGSLSVGKDGSATYTLPIEVPPGRAGLAPQLALTYNSRAGNGPLGVGWSLSGLSQISRCPKSATSSSKAQPVKFDSTDDLCLDGDPIINARVFEGNPVEGGGISPRSPLHDPYTRVKTTESDAMGPLTLTVELKNGRVLRYGGTDAVVDGNRFAYDQKGERSLGAARVAWLLSEIGDRSGNRILFQYGSPSGDAKANCPTGGAIACEASERRITGITYTSHADGGPPQKSVAFEWDDSRPDQDLVWVSGLALKRTGRLKSITVSGPAPVAKGTLRTYQFDYAVAPVSGRSVLLGIKQCDGAGVCRRPASFEYEPGSTEFREIVLPAAQTFPNPGKSIQLLTADFNGDGLDDILSYNGVSWKVLLNDTEPGSDDIRFSGPIDCPLLPKPGGPAMALDLDHDGDVDLIVPQVKSVYCDGKPIDRATARKFTLDGSNFVPASGDPGEPKDGCTPGQIDYLVDTRGDGRPQPVTAYAGDVGPLAAPTDGSRAWSVFRPVGTTYDLSTPLGSETTPLEVTQKIAFADVNADGMADALMLKPFSTSIAVLTSTGMGFKKLMIDGPLNAKDEPAHWYESPDITRIDLFQDGHPVWMVTTGDVSWPNANLGTPVLQFQP